MVDQLKQASFEKQEQLLQLAKEVANLKIELYKEKELTKDVKSADNFYNDHAAPSESEVELVPVEPSPVKSGRKFNSRRRSAKRTETKRFDKPYKDTKFAGKRRPRQDDEAQADGGWVTFDRKNGGNKPTNKKRSIDEMTDKVSKAEVSVDKNDNESDY